jgi:hypothetical protein
MTPIQQLFLGTGAGKTKPYIEDVFSIDLYKGTAAAKTITNDIKLGSGGLVITKNRDSSSNWAWGSPIAAMGTNKYLRSNTIYSATTDSSSYTAFNNNGYTIGSLNDLNANNDDFVSYSFKKTPGLVDVISYVGDGTSSRVLSHDLGSVPGWIAITCTTKGENKTTWHRGFGDRVSGSTSEYYAFLDSSSSARNGNDPYPALPTSTQLTIGSYINITGETFVAYIFGGGESPAATARSVDFTASDSDYLTVASSSDFAFGTGDFTVEAWVKNDGGFFTIFDHLMGADEFIIFNYANGDVRVYAQGMMVSGVIPGYGKWYHLAVVRQSGVLQIYVDGVKAGVAHNFTKNITQAGIQIGRSANSAYSTGRISNLRVVKGTAVYTSSFKPSNVPLTSITGTVLLCCNNSSVTGKTTGGTITAHNSPTASTESPFLDPAGFVFGENENEPIIATGSYQGNGNAAGPEIYLGWEPQLVLFKNATVGYNWKIFDSMRGISSYGNDVEISFNDTNAEDDTTDFFELTSTGFRLTSTDGNVNHNNSRFAYVAIRRPDPLVAKTKTATELFAMAAGNGSTTVPAFTSGFPVDMRLGKKTAGTHAWYLGTRFMYKEHLRTNLTDAQTAGSWSKFDYNLGEGQSWDSSYQGYMWRRGQGFDVVGFQGTATDPGPSYVHSLGVIPELKFIKRRNSSTDWMGTGTVVSQAMAGNNNSMDYFVKLNSDVAASNSSNYWTGGNDTSTHFTVRHGNSSIGGSNDPFLCLLFASVTGISKCGYYTGDGTTNGSHEITLGFTPRFLMIKCITSGVNFSHWNVWDSLRGLDGSGSECYLKLNTDGPEVCSYDYLDTTASGFKLNTNYGPVNGSGNKMIYYAHA